MTPGIISTEETTDTGGAGLSMADLYDPFDRPPCEKRRRLNEQ